MNKGKLYLIPSPLGEGAPEDVLPKPVFEVLPSIRTFVVEEVRTARRFLSSAGLKGHIQDLEFHTLNEHTSPAEVEELLPLFDGGAPVGLIPDQGLSRPAGERPENCRYHPV